MVKVVTKKNTVPAELSLLNGLLNFDRKHQYRGRSKNPQCILVGTDEVGRGSFAGPVVAAAVMLPSIDVNSEIASSICQLNDSKLIAPSERERLAAIIMDIAIFAIAQASTDEIDELNVLNASLLAMRRALERLYCLIPNHLPAMVLVDGNKRVQGLDRFLQTTVIQGDSQSASIAAASIIAKVHRDQLMDELSIKHPQYQWHKNKGYGTPTHREALQTYGLTCHHRKLFCRKVLESNEDSATADLN